MTNKTLDVQGMSCDHCKMAVTKAVSELEGVRSVEVSLESNSVSVEFDETRLQLETISQAIEDQGYDVL